MTWRKSTFSSGNGGECVEVADFASAVLVRDTKNRDAGSLSVPADAWVSFVTRLK